MIAQKPNCASAEVRHTMPTGGTAATTLIRGSMCCGSMTTITIKTPSRSTLSSRAKSMIGLPGILAGGARRPRTGVLLDQRQVPFAFEMKDTNCSLYRGLGESTTTFGEMHFVLGRIYEVGSPSQK